MNLKLLVALLTILVGLSFVGFNIVSKRVAEAPSAPGFTCSRDDYEGGKCEPLTEVPLPRAKPAVEPRNKPVRRARRYARVLQLSCADVRWYAANVPQRVIEAMEDQDVLVRGLSASQKAQQRREARACLH